MRASILILLWPGLAGAAVWPETMGEWKRAEVKPAQVADRPVWDEYGLKEAETATFQNGDRHFTATGYRLVDPTGALAALQWQTAQTPKQGRIAQQGNFLFRFDDYQPSAVEFAALTGGLRNLDSTSLPVLPGFLPSSNLVSGSQRYILGPVSLEKFVPGIPPSVASFSMGAEAQAASFASPKGDLRLVLFNYPTPQMAMQKVQDFQKVPGVIAKRSGPLVAAIVAPPDPDAAERLLGEVRYEAQITLAERMPTQKDNIGDLIVNAFVLIGILLGFSLVAGLTMGGFRVIRQILRKGPEPEAMITLHLEQR